jgi:chromosome segregation ATPase
VKEREIMSRRRELEQWDSLLREKDRKSVLEQRQLEEREESVRLVESKVRSKEMDCEKRALDLRQKDAEATILVEKYTTLRQDLEMRERHCQEQTSKYNSLASSLMSKESTLNSKEMQLKDLEVRFNGTKVKEVELEKREMEHNKSVDKFYNKDIAMITARHAAEIRRLEELINQQLIIVSNFQSELEKVRGLLDVSTKEKEEMKVTLNEKLIMIERLEAEVKELEEEKETVKLDALEERVRNVLSLPHLLIPSPALPSPALPSSSVYVYAQT